jgi:hypothetical protein
MQVCTHFFIQGAREARGLIFTISVKPAGAGFLAGQRTHWQILLPEQEKVILVSTCVRSAAVFFEVRMQVEAGSSSGRWSIRRPWTSPPGDVTLWVFPRHASILRVRAWCLSARLKSCRRSSSHCPPLARVGSGRCENELFVVACKNSSLRRGPRHAARPELLRGAVRSSFNHFRVQLSFRHKRLSGSEAATQLVRREQKVGRQPPRAHILTHTAPEASFTHAHLCLAHIEHQRRQFTHTHFAARRRLRHQATWGWRLSKCGTRTWVRALPSFALSAP